MVSVSSDSNLGTVQAQSVNVTTASTSSTSVTLTSSAPATLVVGSSLLGSVVTAVSGTSVTLATDANTTISSSTAENYYGLATIVLDGGTLDATSSFSLSETSPATVNREIILGADGGTIQVESGQSLTLAGNVVQEISGAGVADNASLTKTGSGTLVLSGAFDYTGGTYLSGGTLKTSATDILDGSAIAAGGSALTNPFVISNGATLDLAGTSQFVGPLTLVNGTIKDSSGGAVLHAFSLTVETGTVSANIGDYDTNTPPANAGGQGYETGLIKTGTGTVVLSGSNTYSGGTEINGGVLQVDSAESATAGAGGPLGGRNVSSASQISAISFGGGTLQFSSVNQADYSARIVNSTSAITIDTNGETVTFGKALSSTNTGGLTLDDTAVTTGTLALSASASAPNLYSGPTTVIAGTLYLFKNSSVANSIAGGLGLTTNALVVNGGKLDLDGTSQTVGNFSSTDALGTILNSDNSTTGTLTVGNGTISSQNGTYSGLIENHASGGTGTIALTHIGSGTTTLSGANTYTGGTTDSSGALLITNTTGSALGTGTLTVAQGATFGGSGSATGLAAIAIGSGGSGTAQVQVGAGGASLNTNLTLGTSGAATITFSNLAFNLSTTSGGSGAATPGTGVGTTSNSGNEMVIGKTALTLTSSDTLTLNLVGGTIIPTDTPFILIAGSGGTGLGTLADSQYANSVNDGISTFTNSQGQLQITGLTLTFTGQPPSWYSNSYLFLVDTGSGANNIDDIDVEVVPEPGTWAMMLGGLAALVFWQRRKGKQD